MRQLEGWQTPTPLCTVAFRRAEMTTYHINITLEKLVREMQHSNALHKESNELRRASALIFAEQVKQQQEFRQQQQLALRFQQELMSTLRDLTNRSTSLPPATKQQAEEK